MISMPRPENIPATAMNQANTEQFYNKFVERLNAALGGPGQANRRKAHTSLATKAIVEAAEM
jgi:hypothetical protein